MAKMPGMLGDVYFGAPETPLPNWRTERSPSEDDENAEDSPLTPEARAHLVGMLGFDPGDIDNEGTAPAAPIEAKGGEPSAAPFFPPRSPKPLPSPS